MTAARKTPSTSIPAWPSSPAVCIASTASSWSSSMSIASSKSCRTPRLPHSCTAFAMSTLGGDSQMRTCLVVDDSSVIRKIARRILEEMGFHVVEAEDGQQALEVCKRELPEAVLLDWNMPVMDGYDFLGNLRRMPGGDQPKVVFCTTENDVAHIARALHAGANEYIMKPFDKDIVAAKFQEVGLFTAPAGFTVS